MENERKLWKLGYEFGHCQLGIVGWERESHLEMYIVKYYVFAEYEKNLESRTINEWFKSLRESAAEKITLPIFKSEKEFSEYLTKNMAKITPFNEGILKDGLQTENL